MLNKIKIRGLQNNKGFTLLEVLLVIVILAVLVGVFVPVYQSLQIKNNLSLAAQSLVQSLRRAQALSQAADGDSSWGVYATAGQIIIFKGSDYSTRSQNFDEISDVADSIVFSGIFEVVFSKVFGAPNLTGTFTLTATNNSFKNININEKGTASY